MDWNLDPDQGQTCIPDHGLLQFSKSDINAGTNLAQKKRARTCDVRAKGNHELLAIDADLVIVRHLGC